MTTLTPEWTNFFVAELGATATLTGFVVVAISINLSRILAYQHLPGRAADALLTLTASLVLLSLWLIPYQGDIGLGVEALAVAVFGLFGAGFIHFRTRKGLASLTRTRQILRAFMDYGASLIFVVAALLLLNGKDAGLV